MEVEPFIKAKHALNRMKVIKTSSWRHTDAIGWHCKVRMNGQEAVALWGDTEVKVYALSLVEKL